jgi:hypothetical protein
MIDFMKKWEPFVSDKELKKIAEEALKEIEKEEGHNFELIKKKALKNDYWQKLLLKKLREKKKKKKKKKKLVIQKSEYTGEYVLEEEKEQSN